MKHLSIAKLVSLVSFTLLVACESESASVGIKLEAMSFAGSEWSEPVNLAAINTGATDAQANLSPDELSLYFQSDRTGDADIWVSHRACRECDWEAPVNLGPVINTTFIENGPALSIDGHLLFFFSTRPGTGGNDIYVSRRTDTHDDFAWGPPEILGADVNTAGDENAPHYQQSAEPGGAKLYFTRGPAENPGAPLNSAAFDQQPSLSFDGQTLVWTSNRPGSVLAPNGLPSLDIWMSTRTVSGR